MVRREPVTVVATLGGKPDIITFALDYILDSEQLNVEELVLIHLSPPSEGAHATSRIHLALQRVSNEFSNGRYRGHGMEFTAYPIQHHGQPLDDIRNDAQANGVWESVNSLIYRLKNEYRTLHICISGGRRMLALQTLSAAMMHFGHHDVLWHMYTPEAWKEKAVNEGLLHLPENSGFQLIRVPMVPWNVIFPSWGDLAQKIMSNDMLAQKLMVLDKEERRRCQEVIEALTPRPLETLKTIVKEQNLQNTAVTLDITMSTVNSHKTKILDECRIAWGLKPESHLDYRFIIKKFEPFF